MLSNNKRNINQNIKNSNISKQGNNKKNRSPKEGGYTNYSRRNRGEYQKKSSQRYNTESVVSRIANPRREETVEDIRMDIEKLEKEIQFEIKQIRSTKLGL
ncbi:MAG: hypothetical protein GX213_15145 [Clostridiaceae bacterium]|nr:hypothetical protein [Clostridiaceae bacterium]